MGSISVIERRKNIRVDYETVVDLKLSTDEMKCVSRGSVKDIGLGGLKIESCHEMGLNEVVVNFGTDSFLWSSRIRCKIAWVKKNKLTYLYGMEFLELKFWEKVKIWLKTTAAGGNMIGRFNNDNSHLNEG